MNDQIFVATIGLAGAVIGGVITSIPIYIQEFRKHKRWLIENKIAYLKNQVEELDQTKKLTLKDLHSVLNGKKFEDNDNFVSSIPMEVIDVLKKHLPSGKRVMIKNLSEAKKQKIFTDTASALEQKRIELQKNIKELLS